jgi:hypothetical protein
MVEQDMTRVIGDLPFRLRVRGSNVVDIEPKGTGIPLYANLPKGILVEKNRFIPEPRKIIW